MKAYGHVWLLVAVLVAAPGLIELVLVVTPLAAWSAALAAGGMSSLVCVALRTQQQAGVSTRAVALAGVLGAVTASVATGLAALVGGVAGVLVLVLAGCHPLVLRAAARRTRRWCGAGDLAAPPTTPANRAAAPLTDTPRAATPATGSVVVRSEQAALPPTDAAWPEVSAMPLLSTAELCWGWRTSFTALERVSPRNDLQRRLVLIAVRQRYLDEIARRDPAGFFRWLQAGARPAGDPSRYLRTPPGELRSASPCGHEAGPTVEDRGPSEPGCGVG